MNTQIKTGNLEIDFRNILKVENNRNWVMESASFEIALSKYPEFRDWIRNYDKEEIKKLWNRFMVTYLSRNFSEKKKELGTQVSADPVPTLSAPESDSQLQAIYDYIITKMKQGYFRNCFRVELWNNPKILWSWIDLNGYSYDTVQAIYNLAQEDYKALLEERKALYMTVPQLSEDFPEESEEQEIRITR